MNYEKCDCVHNMLFFVFGGNMEQYTCVTHMSRKRQMLSVTIADINRMTNELRRDKWIMNDLQKEKVNKNIMH